MSNFDKLREFRHKVYSLIGNGRDALFDLMGAVLVSRSVDSFADLSLSPVFRRQWSSLYEALQDSEPPRLKLMELYIEQMPLQRRIVLAGDHTAWSRLQAQTLPERTYEYQATPMSGARPVTLGQGHSTIAWIPEVQGSWALPLLHERISSAESPIEKAVVQLRQVCQKLRVRPLSLWDAEYGCASFLKQTADIACDNDEFAIQSSKSASLNPNLLLESRFKSLDCLASLHYSIPLRGWVICTAVSLNFRF